MKLPISRGTAARQGRGAWPEGTYEDEHGRNGFAGPVSMLYHSHPPTGWTRIEGPLRPRAGMLFDLATNDLEDPRELPTALFVGDEISVLLSRRRRAMPYTYRNIAEDELLYVHRGAGKLVCDYGILRYEEGDYLLLPRGTGYRLLLDGTDNVFLVIRSHWPIGFPDRGLLGHHAQFDLGVVDTPEPAPATATDDGEHELLLYRKGMTTSVFYSHDPCDVIGWQGTLVPMRLNVRDIRPVASERLDLPPSAYATFKAGDNWICTFTPHPLQSDPTSAPTPSFHRNVDYDELFFIVGNEGGWDIPLGIGGIHPAGVQHGPTLAELSAERDTERPRFDVTMVTVDTAQPVQPTAVFESAEISHFGWFAPHAAEAAGKA
ncbi:MAG: homogentisate 1,2-dioxygenase [Actinobacteria bacterium]|nr:homogentisate 1,2-dioxygenase [Actinomycetota bacterium]